MATNFSSASLYVGDLNADVTEAILFEIFNAVGPVSSVRICRDATTRRSLGYAYVNFHRLEDAERALDTINFKQIRNRPCRIMWCHRDPSLRRSGVGNIFVKNLAPTIDNKSLYDTFSMFGNILSCKVSMGKNGESLGYGFVHYETEKAAQTAIQRVDGKVIAGQKVIVAPFIADYEKKGNNRPDSVFTNVYVKNLPKETTEEELKTLFSKFGEITSLKIVSTEGKPTISGFVNFTTHSEAVACVEGMVNYEFNGSVLFVARAQRKEEREKELRERFEQLRMERLKKYEGINLYVKNLSDGMTEEKLAEVFGKHGNLESCKMMLDASGKSKGFGFVCYSNKDDSAKAIAALNGTTFDGKQLYVALAQRKEIRRSFLEQQHNSRNKNVAGVPAGVPPQIGGMYSPQAPMFYAPGMPSRNFMYPQQMVPRGYRNANGPPQMMVNGGNGRHPNNINYQLMPVPPGARQPAQQNMNNRNGRGRRSQNNANGMVMKQNGHQGQRRQQQQQQQQRPRQPEPDTSAVVPATGVADQEPLTIKALAAAPEGQQKQMIGERLFPLIQQRDSSKAGKITGMLLEMDNGELIHLLESEQARNEKIDEALLVLTQAEQQQQA